MTSSASPKAKLESLDGMRGFAAAFVMFHHMTTNHLLPGDPLLLHGSMLVDTFFVISGFVMAYQYAHRLHGRPAIADFLRRRVARVWPLHAAILLFMIAPRLAGLALHGPAGSPLFDPGNDHSLGSWFASLAFLHAMGLYDHAVWNGPSWTLSVEFFAYLLFAALAQAGARRLTIGAGALVLAAVAILVATGFYLAVPVRYSFLRCVLGFFAGVLLLPPFRALMRDRILTPLLSTVLEVAAVALGVAIVWIGPASPAALAFPFACAILVLVLAAGNGGLRRLLSLAPFQALGAWSLGIYLLHIPLLNTLWTLHGPAARIGLHFDAGWGGRETIVFLVLVTALAAAAYHLLEKPARDWLGRRRAPRPASPHAPCHATPLGAEGKPA